MLAERLEQWATVYKTEGVHQSLLKLLTKRFGSVSAEIAARIDNADADQIDAWFDCAIDAACINDVFGPTWH